MGCFSFICKECGEPINSDSFSGENVRLFLLEDGKVIEEMQGQYDSYGRVFGDDGKCLEWHKDWGDVCDLMFNSDEDSGIAAVHSECFSETPTSKSEDDPDQGWGAYNTKHTRRFIPSFHKIHDNMEAVGEKESEGL